MPSETTGGAATGALQGAAAGAAVGGPIGAVAGAIIGGAVGYFSGAEKKLAKKYGRLAQDTRRRQQQMRAAIQRRDVIRQARVVRAEAVAAGASDTGVTSSSVQGAISSATAQTESALTYFDRQVGEDNLYQQYAKKAGKHAGNAAELDTLLGSASDLAVIGANAYGSFQGLGGGAQPSTSNFNTTAAVSNMSRNSAFSSFGSSLTLGNNGY
jgi:hypothetical protein